MLARIGLKLDVYELEWEQREVDSHIEEVTEFWKQRKRRTANLPLWVRDFSWQRSSGDSDTEFIFYELVQGWPNRVCPSGDIIEDKVALFPQNNPRMAVFRGFLCDTVSEVEGPCVGEKYYKTLWRYRKLVKKVRWAGDDDWYGLCLLFRQR